jgi:hypothetical protein
MTALTSRTSPDDYPSSIAVSGPNEETLEFIRGTVAAASQKSASKPRPAQPVFDLRHAVLKIEEVEFPWHEEAREPFRRMPLITNVVTHGNSRKTLDSYNWSLMKLLRSGGGPRYDFVYVDGAHTWNVDALTFFLVDRLLDVGGYIDFDDYTWSLASSPSLNPTVFPFTAKLYTPEQIEERQVALVVDLLVKRSSRYVEVVPDKIYQKLRSDA